MRIALLGYGKMGKTIEKIALERGHDIVARIDVSNSHERESLTTENTDVVIEFSSPVSAFSNIHFCMERGIRTVSGTTGWLDKKPEIEKLCAARDTAFFYASNYSIGVNLFFKLNNFLAALMKGQNQYEVTTTEIHHTEKLDSPSGTAITLAEGIIAHLGTKDKWVNNQMAEAAEVPIWSAREGRVPGTHVVKYISDVDQIEIRHEAFSRQGFALGAVVAAEWLADKKGILGMDDMLQLN